MGRSTILSFAVTPPVDSHDRAMIVACIALAVVIVLFGAAAFAAFLLLRRSSRTHRGDAKGRGNDGK